VKAWKTRDLLKSFISPTTALRNSSKSTCPDLFLSKVEKRNLSSSSETWSR